MRQNSFLSCEYRSERLGTCEEISIEGYSRSARWKLIVQSDSVVQDEVEGSDRSGEPDQSIAIKL
jgi:hypothetical protein